jgi:copper homeostasis protein
MFRWCQPWPLPWHTKPVRPLLEVIALGPGDVKGAEVGGADRLAVVADVESEGLTPAVDTVREIATGTDLPVRVMLRGNDGYSTSGSEITRLQGAAHEFAEAGAEGFVLGFLGPTVEIDVDATLAVADEFGSMPWTFHRAVDHVLDYDKAWHRLRMMPRMDTVLTAGSARGVDAGLDELCRRAADDSYIAGMMMAGGGLQPDHVPWLARAGVRKFHVGPQVRPGGSWKAYVDRSLVRSWRTLVDDAVAAAL